MSILVCDSERASPKWVHGPGQLGNGAESAFGPQPQKALQRVQLEAWWQRTEVGLRGGTVGPFKEEDFQFQHQGGQKWTKHFTPENHAEGSSSIGRLLQVGGKSQVISFLKSCAIKSVTYFLSMAEFNVQLL